MSFSVRWVMAPDVMKLRPVGQARVLRSQIKVRSTYCTYYDQLILTIDPYVERHPISSHPVRRVARPPEPEHYYFASNEHPT